MNRAEKYNEIFDIIVSMARTKMLMNAHKGDIESVPLERLIQGGKDEMDELKEAVEGGSYVNIIEEAADVLNFTVASVFNAVNEYRTRKNANPKSTKSMPHSKVVYREHSSPTDCGGTQLGSADDSGGNCRET